MMSLKQRRQASGSVSPGPAKSPKVADRSDEAGPSSSSSSNRSDAEEAAQSSSLAGFKCLPQELRTAILEMACYSRFDNGEGVSQLRLDTQMVANLALVSRGFNSTFNPLLYRQVSLDRPSKLNSFYQSLLSKPTNAQHVESLHLGPMEDLPEGWWPFSPMSSVGDEDYEDEAIGPYRKRSHATIKTSLSKRDEALGLLPEWVEPEKVFAYQEEPKDCKEAAVLAAIRVALEGIGVDPYDELANATDQIIRIDRWTERLFQAQAVLDLYLCAMRRAEDEKSARRSERLKRNASKGGASGQCGYYPSVILEGFEFLEGELRSGEIEAPPSTTKKKKGGKQKSTGQNRIVITREQVEAHLARKGAYTDHFDHPLMYARSDLRQLAISDWNRQVIVDYDRDERFQYYGDELLGPESDEDPYSDDDDHSDYSVSRRRTRLPLPPASSATSRSLSKSLSPTHQPGLVGIAHAVLALTTGVKNLSLMSYFSECITGQAARPALLDKLLYLSIGPLSPTSQAMHCLASVKLPLLEKLRFCGETPGQPTAEQMAGTDKNIVWPSLKTVQWEFGHSGVSWVGAHSFIIDLIDILQGRQTVDDSEPSRSDRDGEESASRSPSPAQAPMRQDQAQAHPAQPIHRRSIEARLPQDILACVLHIPEHPHPPEIRAAWRDGLPVSDAPHIVKVARTGATRRTGLQDTPDSDEDELMLEMKDKNYEQDVEVLREESRAWWEQRALECRKGRQ